MSEPTDAEQEVARVLRENLLVRPQFLEPVVIEAVRLEGGYPHTQLLVMLRLEERPERLYGLRTTLSAWDFPKAGLPEPTPSGWAGWVFDAIMEAIEADPGLPDGPLGNDGVIWVDID
jgi:hypothetical protein